MKDKQTVYMSDSLVGNINLSDFNETIDIINNRFFVSIHSENFSSQLDIDSMILRQDEYIFSFRANSELACELIAMKEIESLDLFFGEKVIKEFSDIHSEAFDLEIKFDSQYKWEIFDELPTSKKIKSVEIEKFKNGYSPAPETLDDCYRINDGSNVILKWPELIF